MFYPIQAPYILNTEFSQHIQYIEKEFHDCRGFAICYWEMQPLSKENLSVSNIIVPDACIDLIVNFDEKLIGFSGMSKTAFDFKQKVQSRSFGVRMMPGAFYQLTGISADMAMDNFLPVETIFNRFDSSNFFSLSFDQSKKLLRKIFINYIDKKIPNKYTNLFNVFAEHTPKNVQEISTQLHFSSRKCQRLFKSHYGITPKMALNIIRFHKCLKILTSPTANASDILNATNYYDQSHFQNDFKRNIGITPLEFLSAYQS